MDVVKLLVALAVVVGLGWIGGGRVEVGERKTKFPEETFVYIPPDFFMHHCHYTTKVTTQKLAIFTSFKTTTDNTL